MLILAVVSELLREAKVVHHERWLFQSDIASSVYLAVQMGLSFTMMLLVMLFDFGVVVSACVGLALGHWLGRKWRRHAEAKAANRDGVGAHDGARDDEDMPLMNDAFSPPSEVLPKDDDDSAHLLPLPRTADSLSVQDAGVRGGPKTPDTTPCCRV